MVFETNANVVNDSHDGVWRVDLTRAEGIMGRILRRLLSRAYGSFFHQYVLVVHPVVK